MRPIDSGEDPDHRTPVVNPHLEVRERHAGRRPGDAYVRIVRPFEDDFESGGGRLVATERTILQRDGWHSALRRLRTVLIGRPIPSEHEGHERLTKLKALAIFSSDNISSSAYATEEMMRILVVAGAGGIALTMPLTFAIVAVLAVVATSYLQTIKAYPNGASSYIVASDNLGVLPGLLAAAALLIDYVLTVAVSVSAGVAAITSIVPSLFPERVLIAVAIVAVLMLGNLRGIRESGTIFMTPTYLYIGLVASIIGIGLVRELGGNLGAFQPPPMWLDELAADQGGTVAILSLFIVLRAFSSGAAGLTGVEAVSDGVPAFKPPEWRNARITLAWQAGIFSVLFLGISHLSSALHVIPDPSEQRTVLALMTRQISGDGALLVSVQLATALVLALAANTSFADFPRLSSFLARDGFMPRQFGFRGERLAFTTGIVALSMLAILLLVTFNASVTALIPLYTLGVFIAFTLSQGGMVVRWWRRREPGWRRGLLINGSGALTTCAIAAVVGATKFLSGAWMVVLMMPILIVLMIGIRAHYRATDRELTLERIPAGAERAREPIVIVPVARLDRAARQAIAFARSISETATAVHVTNDAEDAETLRARWPDWAGPMELVVVESPYRALVVPLLRYMDALQLQDPSRPILVVLSEFVPQHWWQHLLHNQTALRLKLRLFARRNTIVADVPYHVGGVG
ncbi:MAG: APC family permease [Chloroflexota bacterium]